MADLKTVIAQLKAQQEASQKSKQAPVQAPVEAKEEDLDNMIDDEDDPTGEVEENQVPVQEVPNEDKRRAEIEHQQAIEMELLQNNGRFRAEMLYQLQELNKALVVIAEILVKR